MQIFLDQYQVIFIIFILIPMCIKPVLYAHKLWDAINCNKIIDTGLMRQKRLKSYEVLLLFLKAYIDRL